MKATYWQGRFGEFVRAYPGGIPKLAADLGVTSNAVYNWVECRNDVKADNARKIVELSMSSNVPLSLEDVLNHKENVTAAACGK